jgi:hypothetical protein
MTACGVTNSKQRRLLLSAAAWLVCLACTAARPARGLDEQRAVQAGREALASRSGFPWYDRQDDSLRRIDVRTRDDAAKHRNSTWQADPARPSGASRTTLRRSSVLGKIVQTVLWFGLLALLALLIFFLVRAFMRAEPTEDSQATDAEQPRSEEDLIESLPFDVTRPQSDLLGEARRHYEQGAYGEAIIYLFSYQLVRLDQQHLIRLTRGKTNRQYLGELVSRPRLQRMLESTMVAFEDVFFGHHDLQRDRFEACWSGLDEFHRRLDEVAL